MYPEEFYSNLLIKEETHLDPAIAKIIADYTIPEEYYLLSIDNGGEPATASELISALQEIEFDFVLGWHLAQVHKFHETTLKISINPDLEEIKFSDELLDPRNENIVEFINNLPRIVTEDPISGMAELRKIVWPKAYYPFPKIDILEAYHENPTKILTKIKAAGLIMLLSGLMISAGNLGKDISASNFTDTCATVLTEGKNPEAMEICKPVAEAVATRMEANKERTFSFKKDKDGIKVSIRIFK